ncbi:unnamed protein product [Musa acuminata var. zebrina]
MKHLDRDSIQLLRGLVGPIIASIYKGGGTHVQGLVYRGAGCICFLGSGRLPLSLLFCGKVKRREGREVVSSGHRLVSRQRAFISRGKWHHCASWASAAIREVLLHSYRKVVQEGFGLHLVLAASSKWLRWWGYYQCRELTATS